MASISTHHLAIRKALNGQKAVYSIEKHPGLYLSADGKGGGSWRIKYRPRKGATQRWHTITNDARNVAFQSVATKATELLAGLKVNGVDPKKTPPATLTFALTFDAWIDSYAKQHKKSWASDIELYNRHIKQRLGSDTVGDIDRTRIIEILDRIAVEASPIQADKCQAIISAVFSWALDEGRLQQHPALRIRKRGTITNRELVMNNDQLRQFWQALEARADIIATILKLLLLLGTRLNEVVGMRRTELHLSGTPYWMIAKERTKNGRSLVLPLSPLVVGLIETQLAQSTDAELVFPARYVAGEPYYDKFVSRSCKSIFRAVGADDMRLHDLRHQAATGMAQCGVPLDIRQRVQNQITGQRAAVGTIYDQHDYFQEKTRALALWETRLFEIVEAKPLSGLRW